jgi:rhodanese-related sulfurtransferase
MDGERAPFAKFSSRIGEVYIKRVLMVYCKSRFRSSQAMNLLIQNNFPTALLR